MAIKVYLSPSNHGVGQNPCRHKGCYEDKHTRPIANATAKYLKACGITVYVADANKGIIARCAEADRLGVDIYIPIHSNAASASARYLMFMAMTTTGEHMKMLKTISKPVHAVYPDGSLNLVARPDLIEVNTPKAKTFYCEMGFHTNKKDCDEFIHKPDMIGKALAEGICNYFGVKFKESKASKPAATSGKKYKVQVGAFSKKENAEELLKKLEKAGFDGIITD